MLINYSIFNNNNFILVNLIFFLLLSIIRAEFESLIIVFIYLKKDNN